ncbi:uncharacterized protein LTHEOB_11427 [Lasiodiplodia theobromae]|uniref:uncharacterized protein n=1 Tax=Lasiodiplodia theobromae TaxID=45133 RepID=UPI0015C353C1|nr:uncharacterized protein LTHEOB_11427 [Lasiodiplodia theobromae]KAF4537803.1 hypothetical protein LTHEOB_11427 [Lasiodiplodia theobromae]
MLGAVARSEQRKTEGTMATTDVWKTVQASWVEGRLENVIERKKQLAALHGNLTRLQKKGGLDSKFGALKELDFIISAVAELHNSLDIHVTQNTEKSLVVGNKTTTLLRPLGVALIIGSEAAPLSSCLLPFAAALAAGCPTVVAAPGGNKQAVSHLREIVGSGIDGEACVVTVIDGQDDETVWTRLHFDVASIPDSDPESTVAKALRQANPFIRILQPLPGHRIAVVDRSAANLDQIAAQLSRAATSHRTSIPKIMLVDEFTIKALEASLSSFASRSEAKSSFAEILSGAGAAKDSSSFALKLTGNEFGEAIELLFIPTTSMEDSISLVEKINPRIKSPAAYIFAGEKEAVYLATFIPSQQTFVNSVPPVVLLQRLPAKATYTGTRAYTLPTNISFVTSASTASAAPTLSPGIMQRATLVSRGRDHRHPAIRVSHKHVDHAANRNFDVTAAGHLASDVQDRSNDAPTRHSGGVRCKHQIAISRVTHSCIGLSFPDFSHVSPQDIAREDSAQVPEVQASDLSIISGFAEKLQNAAFYPPFQALRIPPPAVMNVFVQLYFEHFHPIFPMLHQPSFGKGAPRPLLTLAVATIGARYSKLEGASQCALAMTELLRRLAMHLCETDNRFSRQISLLQCIVLHHLSGLHSGDRRLMEVVEINQCIPASLGRRTGLFRSGSSLSPDAVRAIPLEDRWHLWIKEEENRRTSHAMSVLDHHIRLHAQTTSVISKEELRIELPSHEDMWSAPSALAWSNTFQGPYPPPPPSIRRLESHPNPSSLWPRLGHLAKLSAILNLSHAHHQTADISTSILDFIPTLELPADASAPAPHRRRAVDALLAFHWGKLALHCPVRDVMASVFGAIAEHHGSGGGGHGGYGSGAEETGDEGDQYGEHSACTLLTSNRRRARACVRHAAEAYGLLRTYRSAACSAPAVLLHAVAVLWLYARLEETGGGGSDGCRGGGAADESVVVYLDELGVGMGGDAAAAALDFWVECGIGQPRLAGVGVLRTAAGRRRLLAEAETLCEAMGAWPTCWLYRRIFRRLGGVEGEGVV